MPIPSSMSDWPFDPKWLVLGFAAGALAMVIGYDLRIGLTLGSAFALLGLFWLWLRLRFAPEPGEPRSERDAMIERFDRLREARHLAETRERGSLRDKAPGDPDPARPGEDA